MHPRAYHDLRLLCLPHPRLHSHAELVNDASDVRRYYIRMANQDVKLRQVVTAREALVAMKSLGTIDNGGAILQIEDSLDPISSGCIVANSRHIYGELVLGNLMGLTREGWCRLRGIHVDVLSTTWLSALQPRAVDNRGDSIRLTPCPTVSDDECQECLRRVFSLVSGIRRDDQRLFEFVYDREHGLVFTDTKPYPWRTNLPVLFQEKNTDLIVARDQPTTKIYRGPLDSRSLSLLTEPVVVELGSSAVLCHFITHGLRDGIVTGVRPSPA